MGQLKKILLVDDDDDLREALLAYQQRPAGTLLSFERGLLGLEAFYELGHFGCVVGAAEDGHV